MTTLLLLLLNWLAAAPAEVISEVMPWEQMEPY